MTRKAFLCVGALFMMNAYLAAQVYTNFNNSVTIGEAGHFQMQYHRSIDFEIPEKDIEQLLANESVNSTSNVADGPYRFAEAVSINLDIDGDIKWEDREGFSYGRFNIRATGARSTSINFDTFYLPDKSEIYIYNLNGKVITGPITEKENNEKRIWGSWVFPGEMLSIEVKTPTSTKHLLRLHSNNIAYGYKNLFRPQVPDEDFGESQPCNINVVCPLGNGWEAERNSVALVRYIKCLRNTLRSTYRSLPGTKYVYSVPESCVVRNIY